MREIKYRQYLGDGIWHYWGFNVDKGVIYRSPRIRVPSDQYTGLKDKNGKEIYEGDILSNGQHIDWIVVYDEASFKVKHKGSIVRDRWVLSREMAERREVIGNIYEHPHLLEKGAEG